MSESPVHDADMLDDLWLTVEQLAVACQVSPEWLSERLDNEMFPEARCVAGVWRLSSRCVRRARRMRDLEHQFDAAPELAALFVDLLDERDALRTALMRAGRQ